MSDFIHLRVYSDYSLGQSNIKIDNLVKHSVNIRMPALGLTDNSNLFGSLEFSLACAKNGIQPIIGCIVKVEYNSDKDSLCSLSLVDKKKKETAELLIIAKNYVGYRNLIKLISDLYIKNNYSNIISLKQLVDSHEGLIVLCGKESPIGQLITRNKLTEARLLLSELKKVFADDLFIELIRYNDNRHQYLEHYFIELAYEYNIPLVATNPVAYLTPAMHESHDALLCIANNRYLAQDDRISSNPEHYFKSIAEMKQLFADLPEAIDNTLLVAKKCSFMPEESKPLLPKFSLDSNEDELLENDAYTGLKNRISNLLYPINEDQYFERLKFELEVIKGMGFSGYFLIVADFINWSKENGISVGPGRGSGVGSIVAWALKITELDPIHFGLLFERFLNPERVSMPDFDIDFCQIRRDEVIQYVRNKYGEDRVAQIITFGKLQARAVLRDVGRVLQMPYSVVDKICKMVPNNPAHPITLREAIDIDKELRYLRDTDPDIEKLLRISLQLEGIHRHASTHAAGVVIADRPIVELVPLYQDINSSMPAVQYTMKYAEAAGLMKFDFLGLKTLTVIAQALNLVEERYKFRLELSSIPLDDKKTYTMLSKGHTTGVFQFEGVGMREAIKNLKPDCINDLIALASLYRPGPMDNIPHYINRKHGLEKIDYIHPSLTEVLKETYGIIVYQEQVMQIAQTLANYSLGEADLLRRAMGKKNKKEMDVQRAKFIDQAIANGIDEEQANVIFNLVDKFASYGFNKSHAAAYAIISYHTAYLKANYTTEYLVALINLDIDDSDKLYLFCLEAKRFNIKILKPCINSSDIYFKIVDELELKNEIPDIEDNLKGIRFGLAGIKSAGLKLLSAIVNEREKNGKFCDIFDFISRCFKLGLNRRLLEILAKAGAMDSIMPAEQVLQNLDILLKHASGLVNFSADKQISLFSSNVTNNVKLLEAENSSFEERVAFEYEALGFYLTEHPLTPYAKKLKIKQVISSNAIEKITHKDGISINIAGVIISKKIRSSKGRGGKFAFIRLSDQDGIIDISLFNEDLLYRHSDLLQEGRLIFCNITAKRDDSGLRLIVESLSSVEEAVAEIRSHYNLLLYNKEAIPLIKSLLDNSIENKSNMIKYLSLVALIPDKGKVCFKLTLNNPVEEKKLLTLHAPGILEVIEI